MLGYVVNIYRKASVSERQDPTTGRLSSSGETLLYENVNVEIQPKKAAFEKAGIRVEATSQMFCGRPLDISVDDIVEVSATEERYTVIENRTIASSHQWILRKVA